MSWFKKFADEVVEQSQRAPDPNQMKFLFDQKQLSLPITPETPVVEAPEPEAPPPSSYYNHNQQELPATEPVKCSERYCNNESFHPGSDPTFIIDSIDDKPYCSEHFNKCSECSDYFSTDHLTKHNGDIMCDSCYRDNVHVCPNCDAQVTEDDLLPPNRRNSRYSMPNGGCTNCASKCYGCDKVLDNDNGCYSHDNETYCEDCFGESFGTCESCGDTEDRESMRYVDGVGEFCEHCYDKEYTRCHECEEEIEKSDANEANGNDYCESCFEKIGPVQYSEFTEKFEGFSYTKKDKYLDALGPLLPISVKELKSKSPRLADGLRELITFSKGKTLDAEMVEMYRESLGKEEFPVDYTSWSGIQRSIDNLSKADQEQVPDAQLVINVEASSQMLARLQAKPALYNLFDKINTVSKQSTHPYVKDQIGWIRLELDPNNEYVLVDEIQCDHSNGAYQLKTGEDARKAEALETRIKEKYETKDIGSYMISDEKKEEDEDILALRALLKRKFQMNDAALDQMYLDKFIFGESTRDLKEEFPNRRMPRMLIDSDIQGNEDVKTLREIYKKYGKLDDSDLDSRIETGLHLTTFPELEESNSKINEVRNNLMRQYDLDQKGFDDLLTEYASIMNDFPDIATKAVSQFAKKNNFKKLYWHTYESGMKLKNNEPPKSLYEKTPKDNFFKPTEEKPFGLDGQFFERKASRAAELLARKLMLKYAGKLPS